MSINVKEIRRAAKNIIEKEEGKGDFYAFLESVEEAAIFETNNKVITILEDIKEAVKENDVEAIYIKKPSVERQKNNFNALLKNAKVLPRKKVEA